MLSRWKDATPYSTHVNIKHSNQPREIITNLEKRPSHRFKPIEIVSIIKIVPNMKHLKYGQQAFFIHQFVTRTIQTFAARVKARSGLYALQTST